MAKGVHCKLCKKKMIWGDFFMINNEIWESFCKLINKKDCYCCVSCFENIRNKKIKASELNPCALSVPLLLKRNMEIPQTNAWRNAVLICLSFLPPEYLSDELSKACNKAWDDTWKDPEFIGGDK